MPVMIPSRRSLGLQLRLRKQRCRDRQRWPSSVAISTDDSGYGLWSCATSRESGPHHSLQMWAQLLRRTNAFPARQMSALSMLWRSLFCGAAKSVAVIVDETAARPSLIQVKRRPFLCDPACGQPLPVTAYGFGRGPRTPASRLTYVKGRPLPARLYFPQVVRARLQAPGIVLPLAERDLGGDLADQRKGLCNRRVTGRDQSGLAPQTKAGSLPIGMPIGRVIDTGNGSGTQNIDSGQGLCDRSVSVLRKAGGIRNGPMVSAVGCENPQVEPHWFRRRRPRAL